jgi:hypothetical protein
VGVSVYEFESWHHVQDRFWGERFLEFGGFEVLGIACSWVRRGVGSWDWIWIFSSDGHKFRSIPWMSQYVAPYLPPPPSSNLFLAESLFGFFWRAGWVIKCGRGLDVWRCWWVGWRWQWEWEWEESVGWTGRLGCFGHILLLVLLVDEKNADVGLASPGWPLSRLFVFSSFRLFLMHQSVRTWSVVTITS